MKKIDDRLVNFYLAKKVPVNAIARIIGVNEKTLHRHLNKQEAQTND